MTRRTVLTLASSLVGAALTLVVACADLSGLSGGSQPTGADAGVESGGDVVVPMDASADGGDATSPCAIDAGVIDSGCPASRATCDPDAGITCGTQLDVDPTNCGMCGRACEATCTNGLCDPVRVATESAAPVAVLAGLVQGSVYFLSLSPTIVYVAPANGGTPTMLGAVDPDASAREGVSGLAVDESSVYVFMYDRVFRFPIDGSAAPPPSLLPGGVQRGSGFGFDDSAAFFTDGFEVERLTKRDGQVATLVAGQAGAAGLAVSHGRVYYANATDAGISELRWVAAVGGGSHAYAPAAAPSVVAVDTTFVYWSDGPSIWRATQGDSAADRTLVTTIAAASDQDIDWIAVDGASVYADVYDPIKGTDVVYRAPKCGGAAVALTGRLYAAGLALGPAHLYFAQQQSVFRITK